MPLRPYQVDLKAAVQQAWAQGARNVLMRLDTGGGKTVVLADLHQEHRGASALICHRQELVGQLSLALARNGVRHSIVAAEKTRRAIAREHLEVLGACFYQPGAPCVVASVDTLVRAQNLEAWAAQVTLWTVDEGHHLVEDNKWHTAIGKFTHPACRGLLPTATPLRADGKGLGRGQGGVADTMVQGPPMRWLIENGYLTDYEIVCPKSDLQMIAEAGASGDWSSKQLREAAKRSHIVGDVVSCYKRWGLGRLGITFATDVVTATEITAAYQAAGVRAETLTGETDSGVRRMILKRFAAREIHQIVAVDIISEGFDLPAIEVASLARPTQSLALYMQQFGRALRPLPGKDKAIIIDHVGNVLRHQAPDKPRPWSLMRREGARRTEGGSGLRTCEQCFHPYEAYKTTCPYCGFAYQPENRSSPKHVDGDLVMLDATALAALRGQVDTMDMTPGDYGRHMLARGVPPQGAQAAVSRHARDLEAQGTLRGMMALWCGKQHAAGLTDREIQKLWYLTFGMDILTAQTVTMADAGELADKVRAQL